MIRCTYSRKYNGKYIDNADFLTDTVYQARRLVDKWNDQQPTRYEYEVIKTRPYTDNLPEEGWVTEFGISYVHVRGITAMNKVAQELVKIAKSLVSAPRESFEVIVDYISMQTAEDTWEQGEIGHARVVLVQGNAGTFKTIALAVKKASEITGIPEKNFALFEGDEGRIEGQGLVDENNFYVGDDKRFLAEFKAGRVKAWNADVSVRVRFAKVWTPTIQEMKAVSNLGTI